MAVSCVALCLLMGLSYEMVHATSQLLSSLSQLSETQLSSFFDTHVSPAPLQTGFSSLVPYRDIRIHCARPSVPYFEEIFASDANLRKKINFTRPLAVIIHGWTENSNQTMYVNMSTRYRSFVNTNVCLLDYRPYAAYGYMIAARQGVPVVAEYLTRFLKAISSLRFPLATVSVVGVSLGAQVASYTGKALPGRIGTIYALDPAGPLFTLPIDVGPTKRLTHTDAKYVQVVATTRYAMGMGPLVGTENFLPNSGYYPQSPCAPLMTQSNEVREYMWPVGYLVACVT